MKKFVLIFVLIYYSTNCFTQTIVTDRPDQTESAQTVPKKSLQIESGILFEQNSIAKIFLLPTSLFRIGIAKKFELRVLSQIEHQKINTYANTSISNIEIGTKIQLFKQDSSRTQIAFLTHLVLPTSTLNTSKSLGSINKLSISHKLSNSVNLGYNLGYNYLSNTSIFTYTLSLGFSVTQKLGLYAESYGEIHPLVFFTNIDAGLTYLIKDNLQFDFSFGLGLNHKTNYQSVGVSWLIQ